MGGGEVSTIRVSTVKNVSEFYSAGSGIACLSGVDRHKRAWNMTSKISELRPRWRCHFSRPCMVGTDTPSLCLTAVQPLMVKAQSIAEQVGKREFLARLCRGGSIFPAQP
jgi:hypothetical protein